MKRTITGKAKLAREIAAVMREARKVRKRKLLAEALWNYRPKTNPNLHKVPPDRLL